MSEFIQPCRALDASCGSGATEVVVTVNGYVIDCCAACARVLCDPLHVVASAVTA